MAPAVDFLAGLRILKPQRGRRAKVAIDFKVPDLVFAPEDKAIAREMATSLTETWRELWLSGVWLDGRPLPQVSKATAERRQDRLGQLTGGPRPLRRGESRSLAKLQRRYTTRKQGTTYPTAEVSGRNLVGLESGTTARSLSVAFESGATFRIFVSNIRGLLDRSGSSAWLRILKLMGGIGRLDSILDHPRIQAAKDRALASVWKSSGGRLLSELGKLQGNLEALSSTAEDFGEADGG